MFIGQEIHYPAEGYTRWFQRQGDAATFAIERLGHEITGASAQCKITVQTKNSESADDSADDLGSAFDLSKTNSVTTERRSDLKELVRLKLHWTESPNAPSSGDFVRVRVLPPMWEFN